MRKLTFLALILVFPLFVFAQQPQTILLRDAISQKPVEGANIQKDHQPVTSSDKSGRFVLDAEFPMFLTISHIGYYTKELIINKIQGDSLIIELIPKTRDIDEVVVTGKSYFQFFKPETFFIQDYYIQDKQVWALGYSGKNIRKPELRLLSITGKTLGKMPVSPKSSLFQDPTGTVHLYNPDSIFQLYADRRQIALLYPTPMNPVTSLLFNFQIMKGDTVIYTAYNDYRTYCQFIAADLAKGLSDTIFASYNRIRYKSEQAAKNYNPGPLPSSSIARSPPGRGIGGLPSALRNDPNHPEYAGKSDKDIMVAESMKMPRRTEKDTGSEATRESRRLYAMALYKRLIENKPVKVYMHGIQNDFYVFEATNLLLWKLGPDFSNSGSVVVDLHPDAREIRMVQDPTDQCLYVSYQINGSCFIGKMDPSTGKIIKTKQIQGFPFAEKVSVYGGSIYFIYQSPTGQNFTNLYSMNLN